MPMAFNVQDLGTNGDYWDTFRRKTHSSPEQDLLLAVLKDALLSYRKQLRRRGENLQAERAWFFANDVDHVFSFESVCAGLGVSPAQIRRYLREWEQALNGD
jgi:hypothetical protein